jgi:hypothetical protein
MCGPPPPTQLPRSLHGPRLTNPVTPNPSRARRGLGVPITHSRRLSVGNTHLPGAALRLPPPPQRNPAALRARPLTRLPGPKAKIEPVRHGSPRAVPRTGRAVARAVCQTPTRLPQPSHSLHSLSGRSVRCCRCKLAERSTHGATDHSPTQHAKRQRQLRPRLVASPASSPPLSLTCPAVADLASHPSSFH